MPSPYDSRAVRPGLNMTGAFDGYIIWALKRERAKVRSFAEASDLMRALRNAGCDSDEFWTMVDALDRYELADRTADLLKSRVGYRNSHQHYFAVIAAAKALDWSRLSSETAYAFARRRVATLQRVLMEARCDRL